MSTIRLKFVPIRLLTVMLLLLDTTQSFSQQTPEPSVTEITGHTEEFFKTWVSAQVRRESRQLFMTHSTNGWKEHGTDLSEIAWDADRWYKIDRRMWEPWKFPGEYVADSREALGLNNTVMEINREYRPPTAEEMIAPDPSQLSLDVSAELERMSVSWKEGKSGIDRFLLLDQRRNPFLTGRDSTKWEPSRTLLDFFKPEDRVHIESITMLNRQCWKLTIPSVNGRGKASLVICPELQYAPVHFTRSWASNDQLDSGTRISDANDGEGHRMLTSELITSLEAVEPDWSSFTIRELGWSTFTDGVERGFGKLHHYHVIVRPAPEAAFQIHFPPKNGTKVSLREAPQLNAEWHDGKVVRVYDGKAIDELAAVKMASPPPNYLRTGLILLALVGAAAYAWRTFQSRKPETSTRPGRRQG